MRRCFSLLFCCLLVFCAVFSGGCADRGTAYTQPVKLRIVTEKGVGQDGVSTENETMRRAIFRMTEEFTAAHPTVEFELELLPEDQSERKPVLQRIRREMEEGRGPDLFLLPAKTWGVESLFPDVNRSMHDGQFLDISAYYDEDAALEREGLNQTVIDGGCVGDARYALPLRYTVPLALGYAPALKEQGIDLADLSATTEAFFSALAKQGDSSFCPQLQSTFLSAFPRFYDYERKQVVVEQERMEEFLRTYRDYLELSSHCETHPVSNLLRHYDRGGAAVSEETPLVADTLGEITLEMAVVSKLRGDEMEMIPLNASDGALVADVVYWGAVGASCEHPQEAYDFLIQFLSPEFQGDMSALDFTAFEGWPVRTKGFVPALWDSFRERYELPDAAKTVELTDGDFPILQAKIGSVRFETAWDEDLEMMLRRELTGMGADQTDTERIARIAEEIFEELRLRVQE